MPGQGGGFQGGGGGSTGWGDSGGGGGSSGGGSSTVPDVPYVPSGGSTNITNPFNPLTSYSPPATIPPAQAVTTPTRNIGSSNTSSDNPFNPNTSYSPAVQSNYNPSYNPFNPLTSYSPVSIATQRDSQYSPAQIEQAQRKYAEEYQKVVTLNPKDPMGYYKDVAYQPGKPAMNLETLSQTGYANIPGERERVIGLIAGQYITPEQMAVLEKNPNIPTSYFGGGLVEVKDKPTSISSRECLNGYETAVFGEGGKLISGESTVFSERTAFLGAGKPNVPENWLFSTKQLENVFVNLETGQHVSVAWGGSAPTTGTYRLLGGGLVSSTKELFGATPLASGGVTEFIPVTGTTGLYSAPPQKQTATETSEWAGISAFVGKAIGRTDIGTRQDIGFIPQVKEKPPEQPEVFGFGWSQKVSEGLDVLNAPIRKAETSGMMPFYGTAFWEGAIIVEKIAWTAIPGSVDLFAQLGKHPVEYGQQLLRISSPIVPLIESTHWGSMGLTTNIGEFREHSPLMQPEVGAKIIATGVWVAEHPFESIAGFGGMGVVGGFFGTSIKGITTGKAGLAVKAPELPKETELEIGIGTSAKDKGIASAERGDIMIQEESMKHVRINPSKEPNIYADVGIEDVKLQGWKYKNVVSAYKEAEIYVNAETPTTAGYKLLGINNQVDLGIEEAELFGGKVAQLRIETGRFMESQFTPTFRIRGEGLDALQVVKGVSMQNAELITVRRIDTGEIGADILTSEKGKGFYSTTNEPSINVEGLAPKFRIPPRPTVEVLSTDTTILSEARKTSGVYGGVEAGEFRGRYGEPAKFGSVEFGTKFSLDTKNVVENLFEEPTAKGWVEQRTYIGGGGNTPLAKHFPEFMDYALGDIEKINYEPSGKIAGYRSMNIVGYESSGNLVQNVVSKVSTSSEPNYPIFSKVSIFDEDTGLYYPPAFVPAGKNIQSNISPQIGTSSYESSLPTIRIVNPQLNFGVSPSQIEFPKASVSVLPFSMLAPTSMTYVSQPLKPMDITRNIVLPFSMLAPTSMTYVSQPLKPMDITRNIELPALKVMQPQMQVQLQKQVQIQDIISPTPSFPRTQSPPPPPPPPGLEGTKFDILQVPKSGFRRFKELRGRGSPLPFADILSVQRTQLRFGGRSTELPITGKTLVKWTRAAGEGFGRGFPTLELSRKKSKRKRRLI